MYLPGTIHSYYYIIDYSPYAVIPEHFNHLKIKSHLYIIRATQFFGNVKVVIDNPLTNGFVCVWIKFYFQNEFPGCRQICSLGLWLLIPDLLIFIIKLVSAMLYLFYDRYSLLQFVISFIFPYQITQCFVLLLIFVKKYIFIWLLSLCIASQFTVFMLLSIYFTFFGYNLLY